MTISDAPEVDLGTAAKDLTPTQAANVRLALARSRAEERVAELEARLADGSLVDARRLVADLSREPQGTHCPACGQYAKVYRRQVNSAMARSLIWIVQESDRTEWVRIRDDPGGRGGDTAKLAYWRLIVEQRAVRPDGGRAGYWKPTTRGRLWIEGALTIQQYALVYDGRVLDHEGPNITIRQALGSAFNLEELMNDGPATR